MAPTALTTFPAPSAEPPADPAADIPEPISDPQAHGFLPARPPVRTMAGTWGWLSELAGAVATAPDRDTARALVAHGARQGDLTALRQRVSRLSPRNADAASLRVAVIAAACGWSALDPLAPVSRRAADPAFLDLWSAVAHRVGHQQFVALPTLALLNWSPERKPRRALPIDQLARTEPLVPVVRWSPEGQPLGPLDRLMLATTRLEAHGIWLLRLAGTLAGRDPADASTATALRRLIRVQHALRAQLQSEAAELRAAPEPAWQGAVLIELAGLGALEPPVFQAADAVLGTGGRRAGDTGRHQLRRHLPPRHRAWLSALDRHCAPVRTLAHQGGPDAAVFREARESLIALRRTYAGLVRCAARPAGGGLTAVA
ncbi:MULTISPECIES: hypothetical protein [Streptomyces]|uniref:Uncharacterized protein n=1 Tax=Streptomyces rimosus subsp. rimosus TaxID=132474 RepID=A0ABY3Z5L2_STRRM|nr:MULTISPECIES: hypothetical protein [Streptomyces]KEF03945.1 hypothetical protein DF17_26100 [Streptomyces rimosus]KEF17464.1 hypothetical protein DF18_29155 [Streptomyces rimosus]UNZ05615.1 hypothetical protein SRIMR7_26020 [Streptomyces rimosus subsp. rimosus]UTH97070.1 hypothetical protein SRIMHP_23390 [Streptomyces rimosus subsp. rimosus]UTJ15166.1 hypothetical protein SRIMDV3_23280 [Streptomyces rimosus subsp. rimosus]